MKNKSSRAKIISLDDAKYLRDKLFAYGEKVKSENIKIKDINILTSELNEIFSSLFTKEISLPSIRKFSEKDFLYKEYFRKYTDIEKIITEKTLKNQKRTSGKTLAQDTDINNISPYFGLNVPDFITYGIRELYSSFSGKNRIDKELLINGAIPLFFSDSLKGYRLINFFRAIKFSNQIESEELIVKSDSFFFSLRIGKILKDRDDNTIYFKVESGDKEYSVYSINYSSSKNKAKKINLDEFRPKKQYFEVFGKLDKEYLENNNILLLPSIRIVRDILKDEINLEKEKKSIKSKENLELELEICKKFISQKINVKIEDINENNISLFLRQMLFNNTELTTELKKELKKQKETYEKIIADLKKELSTDIILKESMKII